MVIYKTSWRCPYCYKLYAEEYQARDCANDCVEVEGPIEAQRPVCEICERVFERDEDAKKCEIKHAEQNDSFYVEYLVKKNVEGLMKAASHPAQKKLGEIQDE